MANHCALCGEKIGKHETVCPLCASICDGGQTVPPDTLRQFWSINQSRISAFTETNVIRSHFCSSVTHIDNNHKMFYISHKKVNIPVNQLIFKFDEVISYQYNRFPGRTVTKSKGGLGRAVVGGALFGPVGAVVGATTAKAETHEVGGSTFMDIKFRTPYWSKSMSITPLDGLSEFLDRCINESSRVQQSLHTAVHSQIHGHYCPNCGAEVGDANFCPNCGYNMKNVQFDIMQKSASK